MCYKMSISVQQPPTASSPQTRCPLKGDTTKRLLGFWHLFAVVRVGGRQQVRCFALTSSTRAFRFFHLAPGWPVVSERAGAFPIGKYLRSLALQTDRGEWVMMVVVGVLSPAGTSVFRDSQLCCVSRDGGLGNHAHVAPHLCDH